MNQLCKVCGEPAAGFHFGAFTCEGCKSFFGRTYNNLTSISECKNSGECVINKKNRTACKACRLRKCLFVGMSKSGSRYGRRSNWFKIHCLLQEQQQKHYTSIPTSPGLPKTFMQSQYIDKYCNNKQNQDNHKRISSPCGSAGSSADFDDQHSIKSFTKSDDMNKNNGRGEDYRITTKAILSPYHHKDIISMHIPSVLRLETIEQDEPIDLSLKSKTSSPKSLIEDSNKIIRCEKLK